MRIIDKPNEVTEYKHDFVNTVEDSAGTEVEEVETIYYREHVAKREIRIFMEYDIIDTKTGRYLDQQSLNRSIDDEVVWIAYQGSIYDLPPKKRDLVDAPRDPEAPHVLIRELLGKMNEEIARDVIRYFD